MLDELMGRDRNLSLEEKKKYKPLDARDNRHWTKVNTIH